MIKFFLKILAVCLLIGCAGSKQSANTQDNSIFSDDKNSKEENLGTETGLDSKKAHIKKLQGELENVKLQLEERQRLLEELNNIKKTIAADSTADSTATPEK